MKDRFNTRKAFINSALFRIQNLQSGLQQVFEKLSKIDQKADEMVLHLDALSADQHSSQLTTATKKIQKALDAVVAAKEAVDAVFNEINESIPASEEENEEILLDDEDSEDTSVEDSDTTETNEEDDEFFIEKDDKNDDTNDSIVVDEGE